MLSIGDLVLDVAIVPDRRLEPNDDTPSRIRAGGGGQAANFCAWAAWLGEPARLVCRVGRDDTGDRLVEELTAGGVDVCAVRGDEPTGIIAVLVGPAGERTMATQRGASVGLRPEDLDPAWFASVSLLHLPAYSLFSEPLASAARRAVTFAREGGAALALDLSSASGLVEYGPARMLDDIAELQPEFVFATADEAAVLGVPLEGLAKHAVLKLGDAGCQVGHRRVTPPAVAAIDATGAGDALAAAFCAAVLHGADDVGAAERAVEVAAQAVSIVGARPVLPRASARTARA